MPTLDEIYEDFGLKRAKGIAREREEGEHGAEYLNADDSVIYSDAGDEKAEIITVEATFYTARCEGCSGITRTGIDVRQTIWHEGRRIIAVDPAMIPLGSTVVVTLENGDTFEATAQDVGSAIKDARIDVLVETKAEAFKLGRQSAEVEIIERGGD